MAEGWLVELAGIVAQGLRSGDILSKQDLQRTKHRGAKELGAPRLPQDPELLAHLDPAQQAQWAHLLRKKPMRSQSGVAVVAVMSSPAACPHGKCIYCPGGPDAGAPQSYTGFEPSTMRAKRLGYDPYRIVRTRLRQLEDNGHPIDKVEVVVQGGTFPARDASYQAAFVAAIYAACNDGPGDGTHRPVPLPEAMAANERASCRVVGLTVETKPDWCLEPHVDAMLEQGATRIELGIQTLDEAVTLLTNRGHTVADARRAMQVARDAGYKVCVHLMPGLPRPEGASTTTAAPPAPAAPATVAPAPPAAAHTGALLPALPLAGARASAAHFAFDADADVEDVRQLFADPDFRPDMLKIYPTLIVQEGETTIKRWWQQGRFVPMETAAAVDVVARALAHVPEYCRIQRIDRDIPTTHVLAGVMHSNLRQMAEAEAVRRGIRLRDIRAREIGTRHRAGHAADPARLQLVRRDYDASGGLEAFISLEDPVADALAGFVRVRRVARPHRTELQDTAVVRELKVYGAAQRLGEHGDGSWQHRGLGGRLLDAAEEAAWAWGVPRLAVLAGPGVKEYYRRHGFTDRGPYLCKDRP